jgi:hypothetical protein
VPGGGTAQNRTPQTWTPGSTVTYRVQDGGTGNDLTKCIPRAGTRVNLDPVQGELAVDADFVVALVLDLPQGLAPGLVGQVGVVHHGHLERGDILGLVLGVGQRPLVQVVEFDVPAWGVADQTKMPSQVDQPHGRLDVPVAPTISSSNHARLAACPWGGSPSEL